MNFLIYLGHPAHYHLFKNSMAALQARGHRILVVYKTKDVLEDLLKKDDWPRVNLMPGGRKDGLLSIGSGLIVRDIRLFSIVRDFRPRLMAGTSAGITHIGRFLGIPSLVVNEDDAEVVPLFAKTAYPFAKYLGLMAMNLMTARGREHEMDRLEMQ